MFKLCAGNNNTHKEGKLVRILPRSRHPDSARPVVVEVGEFVGGGVDGALVQRLSHNL